ncbi:hypothetical protein CWI39_0645p0010 [Hamiltosporidium magnivora]|uniref:Uncharacterized protein n=1 Tax=Hamiltosporidium magnivora TaxID=148818 RepID=A0A4Q9LFL5_9MICR|nr:hypothetical protein CWI39_0645p0010 [Hamiltosporidium magnivora]
MNNHLIDAPPTYEQVFRENAAHNEDNGSITSGSTISDSNASVSTINIIITKPAKLDFMVVTCMEWKNYNLSKILIFSLLISWIELINQYHFQIDSITNSVLGIHLILCGVFIMAVLKRSKEGIGYLKIVLVVLTYIGLFITVNTLSNMLKIPNK